MAMDKIPFNIVYHDRDKNLTLVLDKEKLSVDEASDLAHQLLYFVQEMEQPTRAEEGADYADAMMAQHDDDPNPYHGDYSED
tara:strand:+ start:243 stop:488 length:246 start_codon:yes stop_codon:yes gene_type:complete